MTVQQPVGYLDCDDEPNKSDTSWAWRKRKRALFRERPSFLRRFRRRSIFKITRAFYIPILSIQRLSIGTGEPSP